MIHPQEMTAGIEVGIAVMVFSMVATLALIPYQQYVIKHTNSTAIKADRLHYKTDLLVNASVIIALLLTFYGWSGFDAVFALGIAIFILYSAWEIVKESIDLLMDHELPDEQREKIRNVALQHPETQGLHDLRTRRSGTMIFIQFHLELDSSLSLYAAHNIAEQVEHDLASLFTEVEIIIHEDPVIVASLLTK
jgi:ferrous-iron efflux pump FieF